MTSPTKSTRKPKRSPTIAEPFKINLQAYNERFVICPKDGYDSNLEGLHLIIENNTNSFYRILISVEKLLELAGLYRLNYNLAVNILKRGVVLFVYKLVSEET